MVNSLPRIAVLTTLLSAISVAGTWKVEMIDHTGPGRFSSLKIDKEGNAHVVYVTDDGDRYPLKYGFWDHAVKRWFVMKVAENASFSSLVLDSKQRPHISYTDYGTMSGSKLHYARWDGTAWKLQAIPLNSDIVSYYTSIVLDANDNPSISFYEYRGPRGTDVRIRLRVVGWNGQVWGVRTVDPQEGSGKFNSMAIDGQGHIHLMYANVMSETAGMRYAFWDGKSWTTELFDGQERNGGGYVGYSACVTLDHDMNPHVTYMNYSVPAVKYAVHKDGHWQIQTVDRVANVAYPDRNSIAVAEDGTPYIGYYDGGQGLLKVAHPEGEKWVAETVDTNGSGATSSMQIVGKAVWLSYADEMNGGLKIARYISGEPATVSPSSKPAPGEVARKLSAKGDR